MMAEMFGALKGYGTGQKAAYDSLTPLNRLVDSVPPESATALRFAEVVDTWLGHPSSSPELESIKNSLIRWRDNDQELEPVLQSSLLLKEVIPLSQSLQSVANAGLQALDYLNQGGRAPAGWREQQLAMFKTAAKPQAELLNMIVPSVEKLVAATTPQ